MASPDEVWEELFAKLGVLRDRWPSQAWTYDRRLRCVSSSFGLSEEAAALAAVADVLPSSWNVETIDGAPADVRSVCEACGGLRPGQKISWGGGSGGGAAGGGGVGGATAPGAFALWWPWADGATLSVRIGLHDLDQPKQRYPRLREVFGIPGGAAPD
jgi:hypothetical protein